MGKKEPEAPVAKLVDLALYGLPAENVSRSEHWGFLKFVYPTGTLSHAEEQAAQIALLTDNTVEFNFNNTLHTINPYEARKLITPKSLTEEIAHRETTLEQERNQIAYLKKFLTDVFHA